VELDFLLLTCLDCTSNINSMTNMLRVRKHDKVPQNANPPTSSSCFRNMALYVWPWLPSWQTTILFCPKLLLSIFFTTIFLKSDWTASTHLNLVHFSVVTKICLATRLSAVWGYQLWTTKSFVYPKHIYCTEQQNLIWIISFQLSWYLSII
jgi:hypothetical protein